jgi:hypothetical protein
LPETTVVSGEVTAVQLPGKVPHALFASGAESRSSTAELAFRPDPVSVPVAVVTVTDAVVV